MNWTNWLRRRRRVSDGRSTISIDAEVEINGDLDVRGSLTQNGAAAGALGETVTENEIVLADNTTNNASTTKHGFLKKLSNVATEFMNGAGNWVSIVLPVKASGSEVNTGTDDAKFVTAKALTDSDYIKEADLPSISLETPTGAINGVNDTFIFTSPPIFVTYQGVIQDLTEDYTLVGSTVTFVVPPVSGTVKGLISS